MDTFGLVLTRDELEYIKRVVCSGMLGGTPDVKSSVYDKIIALSKEARKAKDEKQLNLDLNATETTDDTNTQDATPIRRIAA